MKPKYLLTVAAIVGATQVGFAQYSQDALRFSTYQPGSTSRIKGVGGAGTAIGGDLSSVSGNPAGIGFFTRSEFSLTPEFDGSNVKSNYLGYSGKATKSSVNLNDIAAVFYSPINTPRGANKSEGWLSFNFGIAYDRTNNYYENVQYGGVNPKNSIIDYYANDANNNTLSDGSIAGGTLGAWAYGQRLIDYYTSAAAYQSNAYLGTNQLSNAIRTGGESELSLSMGANYSNKLYLGFGVGITNLRYNTTSTFGESGTASITIDDNLGTTADRNYANTYQQIQDTKGTGFNARFGFIYKPVEAVRFGAVITTPTWYTVNDNYDEVMSTDINGFNTVSNRPDEPYQFTYNLTTPLRIAGGLAVFIQQYGFISGDVEYLDYSSAHLSGDYDASSDNNDIRTLYRSTVNAHIGAEARVTPNVFLRGGYGVQGNPLVNNGSQLNTTSGGIGYRNSEFYIDATYSHINGTQTVYPYELATDSPSALLNKTNNNVYMTIGFRF
jgi:hypothetical protein